MRLSASMSKVNATAQRLPSGQGIGFWITVGSFVGDEFGRETPGKGGGTPRVARAILPRAGPARNHSSPRGLDIAKSVLRTIAGAGGLARRCGAGATEARD